MSTKDKTQQEWQSELNAIKRENQSLKRQNEALKQKELQQKTETKHPEAFWNEIRGKCYKHDTQYIISLIDNKTLSVNDVGAGGETLLHYAAVC
eukprot:602695_1